MFTSSESESVGKFEVSHVGDYYHDYTVTFITIIIIIVRVIMVFNTE